MVGQSREPPRVVDALHLEGRLRFCAALKAVAYRQRRPGRHNCANVTNSSAIAEAVEATRTQVCPGHDVGHGADLAEAYALCAGTHPGRQPTGRCRIDCLLNLGGGRRQLRADVGLPAQTRR